MFGTGVSNSSAVADSSAVPVDTKVAVEFPRLSPSPSASSQVVIEVLSSPIPSIAPVGADSISAGVGADGQVDTARVLASKQFSLAKGISFALVGFIFMLFLAEVLITVKRSHVSLKPGVLAHLAILGFVLFAVWYAAGGAVI